MKKPLTMFDHDLFFPPWKSDRDAQEAAYGVLTGELLHPHDDDPSYTRLVTSVNVMHWTDGVQLRVEKEVSDDLLASEIDDPDFESIEWPHHCLEVYFEDPRLPGMLVNLSKGREKEEHLFRVAGKVRPIMAESWTQRADPEDSFVTILLQSKRSDVHLLNMESWRMNTYATQDRDLKELIAGKYPQDAELQLGRHDDHHDDARWTANLLFKVLLFATSTGHAPVVMKERPTKQQGGKPGHRHRPATKRMVVKYLPEQLVERQKNAQKAQSAGGRKFRGRHGHWRHFRSDKFVNLKGTKKFIYPVPGPDGNLPPLKFVVRKPKGTKGAIDLDAVS